MIPSRPFCRTCQKVRAVAEDAVCPGCREKICTFCGCTESVPCPAGCYMIKHGMCSACYYAVCELAADLFGGLMKEAA